MRRATLVAILACLLLAGSLSAQAQPAPEPRNRGFWIGVGLGYGSLGCDDCGGEREGALNGTLRLGGTISPKLRLGVSTNAWYKDESGVTLSMSNLSAIAMFFPSATGGFHLTGGLGVSLLSLDVSGLGSDSETGVGAVLGLSYDAMLGRSFALTPYINFVGGSFDGGSANFWQVGLAATWP
jgi:hypothetical protein